jgi:hypothetical protein
LWLTLSLEQTLRSFGGALGQSVLFSDWFVGAFYQYIFPFGLQARAYVKYHEHLADQGSYYFTTAAPSSYAKNLLFGMTANYYLPGRMLIGMDAEFGLPNDMAGRGAAQSLLVGMGRIGYRATSFLLLLVEGGYRIYKSEGYKPESLLMTQAGIRLEL